MEVSGYDPFISVEAAWGLSRTVKRAPRLETLIAESDYITLHLPLSDKTKGLIGKEKFAIMKKGVRLVNFARGGLVNNKDLKNAIAEGIIAAYVTDFPDDELISMDNVVAIPHLGASTEEAENNCAIMAVRQLRNFLENGDVKNSVNFPDCGLPRSAAQRIVVATDNVPNMLGQITAILAADKVNIAEMLNKSKGQLAYNIIDVDSPVTEKHVERIKSVKGVIMGRIV
jgi:D-3-phosphoglycerate dehydrogenase